MNQIFLRKTEIGATKEELLEILKQTIRDNGMIMDEADLDMVYRAACRAYEGQKRYSGEEYVTHTINVAIILAEMGAESDVILAGMFCDVAEKGAGDFEKLSEELPAEVWHIVSDLAENNADLAHAGDEVILIKLAERLHNMRTIEYIDDSKKRTKTKETFDIYMPLARKINHTKLIDELNDLAVKYDL